jgi:PAS domain S-box-containing protein/putative nucleotidyltransferase with HDIG domain
MKNIFKVSFLRNILFVSLAIIAVFSLYDIFIAYPSFREAIIADSRDDAIYTAKHLMSILNLNEETLHRDFLTVDPEKVKRLKEDLNLLTIKIFSATGENVFSTNPQNDKGIRNKKEFQEILLKGNVYAKINQKEVESSEGVLKKVDVVEAYVPIMNGNKFMGVFEINYDITNIKKRYNRLRSTVIFLACGLLGLVLITSYKAAKTITESEKAEEAIFESHQLFHALFNQASDIIFLLSPSKKGPIITDVNNVGCIKHGYTREELIGEPVTTLNNQESRQLILERTRLLLSGKPLTFEATRVRKDGSTFPVEVSAQLIHVGKTPYILSIERDITERKRTEELIRSQIKRLNILHSIEKAINSSLDLRDTLDLLTEQITSQLGIDAASILLLNQQTQMLEHVVSRGFRSSALKYTYLKIGEGSAGRAASEKKIVIISNLRKNPGEFSRSSFLAREGFISYFAVPLVAKGQLKGVMELFHRTSLKADPEWLDFLDNIADQAAIAIDNASLFDSLQRTNIELMLAYDSTIVGWSRAMDMRDKWTEGHSRRVAEMTLNIAQELGIKDTELVHIRRGALLHDIGKMAIPDSILLKPGKLTDKEWEIMKRHPEYAYDMLCEIDYLKPALDIPLYHHEKWDGTGYPKGLKGEAIPLAARIFAIVDVWDALSSNRPYRPAWPEDKLLFHIRFLEGIHFDPEVVEVFFKVLDCSRA